MPGSMPGIHVFLSFIPRKQDSKPWMAGTEPGHDGAARRCQISREQKLLHCHACFADDLAPQLGLLCEEPAGVGGRSDHRIEPQVA